MRPNQSHLNPQEKLKKGRGFEHEINGKEDAVATRGEWVVRTQGCGGAAGTSEARGGGKRQGGLTAPK